MSKEDNTPSMLNLSDEDLDKINWDDFVEEPVDGDEDIDEDIEDDDTSEDDDTEEEDDDEVEDTDEDKEDEENDETLDEEVDNLEDEEGSKDVNDESNDEKGDTTTDSEESDSTDPAEQESGEEAEEKEINYQDEYTKLLKPFKANGRQMNVNSVEDARTLMQMGANYNKKMAGLKPALKVVKMLENQGLMDEDKLNTLINISKGDKEAVKRLIKDHKLDLVELDEEIDPTFKANTYNVDDRDVELDSTLIDIEDSDSYLTTLDIIGTKWDKSSQEVIYNDSTIIPILNEQVENGMFEHITGVMESERALNRLKGLSDLDAYKVVGDALFKAGEFEQYKPGVGKPDEDTIITPAKRKVAKKATDPKLKDKKRAASSTKSSGKPKKASDFNPLSLSDEDFDKFDVDKYV